MTSTGRSATETFTRKQMSSTFFVGGRVILFAVFLGGVNLVSPRFFPIFFTNSLHFSVYFITNFYL